MKVKDLGIRIAGTIFGVVACIHLLRLITGISVTIGGWMLPMWINVLGFIACIILGAWLWKLSRQQ
ncbi:MAG: hypothetical protein NTU44_07030 [Bacteroidetes bacterium]|nr:hypothetical protein [Bacteroidota bacterium]